LECDEVCDSTLGVPAGYRCTGACSLERLGYGSILPDFFVGVEIFNIQKRVDRFSAAITWDTNKDAACSFEWGQTAGYFTNIANEIEYKKTHVVQVIDLIPATTYFYGIECHDGWDHQARTPIYQFTTESLEDNTAPANVSNFKAEAATDAIILSWKNPEDADLAGVKIVRSDKFFVKSPTAGTVIFNGSGTRAIDRDAAAGKRYYYTAFAYDKNGNYSSGSLATALILAASQPGTVTKEKPPATKQPWDKQEEQPSDKPFQPQQPEESQDPQRPFPEPQEPGQQPDWETPTSTKEIIITGFPFDALEFYAALGSLRIEVGENEVSFYSGTEFNVKLSKDALDPDVKSLIFSLKRPESGEGDYQNYYFEETQAGRKFELKAMVPDDIGVYDITVSALDTANNVIERTEGKMNVIDRSIITSVVNYKTNLPVPIGGVRVTLYSFDNGEIYKWDASKYLQFNPIYTDDAGSYGFYVPNGKYIVKSEKDHFYKYASLPITVENNLIKQDIELVYIPDINIWIFVLYSAVLIACYLLLRRIVLLIAYQHREKLKTPEGPLHM